MSVTGVDIINRFNINGLSNETTVTGSYVILPTDNNIYVNNTSNAPVTVTLPATPATKQEIWIVDKAGNASTYYITIVGTISGLVNPVIGSNYGGALIKWAGDKWIQKA